MKIILLLAGGAIGTGMRYLVSGWAFRIYDGVFPVGTLMVNTVGSFLIGIIWGLTESTNMSTSMRTFIFIGVFGGFTTFSSYSLETLNLLRDGEWKYAISNVVLSNVLGIALVAAGFFLAKSIIKR